MIHNNLKLATQQTMQWLAKYRHQWRKYLDKRPFLPDTGTILRVRKGSKVSRYARHIIERIRIKRILGANLAFMIIASNFIPTANQPQLVDASGNISNEGEIILTESPIVIKTERRVRNPVVNINIFQGYKFYHPGIDIDGVTGDAIFSIMPGYVEEAGYSKKGYGNAISIRHNDSTTSLYAHLNRVFVQRGEEIKINEPIGTMGSTGRSSGDHLHLEVRSSGLPIDPLSVLPLVN